MMDDGGGHNIIFNRAILSYIPDSWPSVVHTVVDKHVGLVHTQRPWFFGDNICNFSLRKKVDNQ